MKMFHDANAPLADGFRRKELLSISNEDFESRHGFIQWAFPTPESSNQVSTAPVLDLETAVWLAEKPEVSTFLEAMTVRFLEFLSITEHWKQSYNHNHLRISRAIQSLRLLHSWELADWFYNKVKEFAGDSLPVMERAAHIGLPPTSARSHHPDGPKADHALTFKLDHSCGAAHLEGDLYYGLIGIVMSLTINISPNSHSS